MPLVCYDGKQGGGKSYGMFEDGFEWIEREKKDGLVTNQPINIEALYKYAKSKGFKHLMGVCKKGNIICVKNTEGFLNTALTIENALIIVDEAGIFLNRHNWAKLRKENPYFINDVCMGRKAGQDLFYCAQSYNMVDAELLSVTNHFVYCTCLPPFFIRARFAPIEFERFKSTGKVVKNVMTFKVGVFSNLLHKAYDSFHRLDVDAAKRLKSFDEFKLDEKIREEYEAMQYFMPEPVNHRVSSCGLFYGVGRSVQSQHWTTQNELQMHYRIKAAQFAIAESFRSTNKVSLYSDGHPEPRPLSLA
ncbi:MAG TPA: zonular occludens toxin domain-containing protein [Oculatellaceae cyanobacterium]